MTESSADVVIVGGGIVGITTAYYLAKAGVASVVVERDAIGSHASGFAYGGLSPLSGFGIPGPQAEIAMDGMRLHRELSKDLLEETGIDVDFRVRSSLALAFTEGTRESRSTPSRPAASPALAKRPTSPSLETSHTPWRRHRPSASRVHCRSGGRFGGRPRPPVRS